MSAMASLDLNDTELGSRPCQSTPASTKHHQCHAESCCVLVARKALVTRLPASGLSPGIFVIAPQTHGLRCSHSKQRACITPQRSECTHFSSNYSTDSASQESKAVKRAACHQNSPNARKTVTALLNDYPLDDYHSPARMAIHLLSQPARLSLGESPSHSTICLPHALPCASFQRVSLRLEDDLAGTLCGPLQSTAPPAKSITRSAPATKQLLIFRLVWR